MRRFTVIPAEAGTSGREVSAGLYEIPAFGFPSKYYFDGVPPGMTGCFSLHEVPAFAGMTR
jgi:hypothetical protein